jgi:5-methylcytosine-specific restriction endonuclease McrA
MALIDICVESTPAADGTLVVPVDEIVHRLIAYYWHQAQPYYQHGRLRQTKRGSSMVDRIAEAKEALAADGVRTPEAARETNRPVYAALVRSLGLTVAQQPLTHLQTVTAGSRSFRDDFLFDASRFHKKMTVSELHAVGSIRLRPGVATGLSRTARLLKDVLRVRWVGDVVRLNRGELEDADLDGFLFNSPRVSLLPLRGPLVEAQHGLCLYCERRLREVHVDHVLPWSLVPINGVANLVAACSQCNGNKSDTVPVRGLVDRALARNYLAEVAAEARFPVLLSRTAGAAAGIYKSLPQGTPLWVSYGSYAQVMVDF